MDDDCVPARDALERLLAVVEAARHGAPIAGVMPTVMWGGSEGVCGYVRSDSTPADERDAGPFLGLLLWRDACVAIGPVRDDFVIWGDDTEYCLRLRMAGWRFLAAPDALMVHPPLPLRTVKIAGRALRVNAAPPWKQYYGTRNTMLLNRYARGTPVAAQAPRGGWLLRELLEYVGLVVLDKKSGPRSIAMRLYGRLDALRDRTGFTVEPGQTLPFSWGWGQRDAAAGATQREPDPPSRVSSGVDE